MRPVPSLALLTALVYLHIIGGQVAASPPASLLKSLMRFMSKEAASETAEKLTKEVGEETVQRLAAKILQEGGEASLDRTSGLVAKYGTDIVRAIDNSPSVTAVLKTFDDLPADQIPKAARRLAAGAQGRELAEIVARHGSTALRTELFHPGVGGRIVQALGTDGASLCGRLSTDEAIALGRYADDIARVPPEQRKQLLELINQNQEGFFKWLGRFVEANPGTTIGSVTLLAVILPNSERILGGEDEVEIGPDGEVKIKSRPGVVGRTGEALNQSLVKPIGAGVSLLSTGIAMVVVAGLGIFAAIKLWGVFRRERGRMTVSHNHDTSGSV